MGEHKAKSWCEAIRQGHVGRHKARSWCEDLRQSHDGRTQGQSMLGESQREEELWKVQLSICRIDVKERTRLPPPAALSSVVPILPPCDCLLDQRKSLW